jgi:uncharacterized protein (TIGR02757 family)
MKQNELKEFLDEKAYVYENQLFIQSDPIQLVHQFSKREDIEISGLLIALIAWGNRKSIIQSGERLLKSMHYAPHEFIMNYEPYSTNQKTAVHRTFNGVDLDFFLRSLQHIYQKSNLEKCFAVNTSQPTMKERIASFREHLLQTTHEQRTLKHLSNPLKNSAAKRINMYLRWMCRPSLKGVDFGIWSSIKPSELYLPLDVHTGNISRKLNLLTRKQDDWKALEELMDVLKTMDPNDPVKYDFALFGLGAFEKF